MGVATLMAPPRFLIDSIRNPRNGPYLSAMGMTAKLEVNTRLLCLFQMVGLMVEQDSKAL
jgi:hypothetical protein